MPADVIYMMARPYRTYIGGERTLWLHVTVTVMAMGCNVHQRPTSGLRRAKCHVLRAPMIIRVWAAQLRGDNAL